MHDAAYQSAVYRGNLTSFASVGNGGCQWYDYLGVLRARRDNSGTVTVNPDAAKSYAVPAGISANGAATIGSGARRSFFSDQTRVIRERWNGNSPKADSPTVK